MQPTRETGRMRLVAVGGRATAWEVRCSECGVVGATPVRSRSKLVAERHVQASHRGQRMLMP